jgi:hypothetical protein
MALPEEGAGADRPVADASERDRDQQRDHDRVLEMIAEITADSGVPRCMMFSTLRGPLPPGEVAHVATKIAGRIAKYFGDVVGDLRGPRDSVTTDARSALQIPAR